MTQDVVNKAVNPVTNHCIDSVTGKVEAQLSTGGDAHVAVNGVQTAVSGTTNTYTLAAAVAAGSGDAAGQFINGTFKAFTVDIQSDNAIAADEALMICWSTSAGDEANTTVTLDALRTALGTPDGVGHANTFIVTAHTSPIPVVVYDGSTTIKTISVASQGTTAYDIVVRTVE